jgi:multiple sugar transport system permease protein
MLTSLGLSFTETDLFTAEFIGLANYKRLFSTDVTVSLFWKALYNTAYYVFLSIPLTMIVGFLIALLLNRNIRGRSAYRIVYYLPTVIPGIAASLLWLWLFQPEFGIINWGLSLVGIEGPRWLYDTQTAKLALVIMSVWGAGGNMLIFLAGLQGIPTQLYEAATIDGANAWTRFIHITLPMISPTLFFVLVTNIIQSFQIFTTVYVVSDGLGGPANATMMYVLWLYLLAFRQFRMGFASALAWVFFIIIMLFTLLIFRSSSAWVYYESQIEGEQA